MGEAPSIKAEIASSMGFAINDGEDYEVLLKAYVIQGISYLKYCHSF